MQFAKREAEAQGREKWAQGPILPMHSSIPEAGEPEQLEVMKVI